MGLVLYGVAILLDIFAMALRYWIGNRILGVPGAVVLAFAPLTASLAALVGLPSGGLLTRAELGARRPSQREQEAIEQALGMFVGPNVRGPKAIYIIDLPTANAYVIGTTLYIERGLLLSPDLQAVLAHELGHLNSFDGRLIHATRRLLFPGMIFVADYLFRFAAHDAGYNPDTGQREVHKQISGIGCWASYVGMFVGLLGGGFGMWVLRPAWEVYWRQREYQADAFAAQLGQALPLAEALDRVLVLDAATPFLIGRMHPYTELRIDRLLRAAHGDPLPKAERAEYAKLAMFSGLGVLVALPMIACVLVAYVLAMPR